MAKQLVAKCRQSASLIIVARNPAQLGTAAEKFNYKTLLFSRSENATFYAKSPVFPGGVYEAADESPQWMEHFKSVGVSAKRLKELQIPRNEQNVPELFRRRNETCLEKELSLRITAIRETFEEVGVLLCRPPATSFAKPSSDYGKYMLDFDRPYWQKAIHKDPTKFLTLCKELQIVPDLWSLSEWSAWMTPSGRPKRFETAFFLVALSEVPPVSLDSNEGIDYMWKDPEQYIRGHRNKEFFLPPPQLYELSRLANLVEIEKLLAFARQRQCQGSTMMLPVMYKCVDGFVSLLPGDDAYPSEPNAASAAITVDKTVEEFRQGVSKLHRVEGGNTNDGVLRVNVPLPDRHMTPLLNKTQFR